MSQETPTYDQLADGLEAFAADSGDLQRYVVAPAILEMVGPVNGKDILDLYCGAGYLSRRLSALGGRVTAVDSSERLVGIAREINQRENARINYAVAEPNDLSVIEDSSFDDIVCNMGLMVMRDLAGAVAELARLVKLGGRFIFSVPHPCFCMPSGCWVRDEDGRYLYKAVDSYYAEGWWPSEHAGVVKERDRTKHRTLSTYVNSLSARGFTVRRISEPRPAPEAVAVRPHLEIYDRLPAVMVVEAVFPYM